MSQSDTARPPTLDADSSATNVERDWLEEHMRNALGELGEAMRRLRDFTTDQEITYMEVVEAQEWIEAAQTTLENGLPTPYQEAMRQ